MPVLHHQRLTVCTGGEFTREGEQLAKLLQRQAVIVGVGGGGACPAAQAGLSSRCWLWPWERHLLTRNLGLSVCEMRPGCWHVVGKV